MPHTPLLLPTPPPVPSKPGQNLTWANLHGCADALAVHELSQQHDGLILLITTNSANAQRWQGALEFFQKAESADNSFDHLHFPDWETLPYDAFSPHQDITSERLATLNALPNCQRGILTVPVTTLLQKIAPVNFLRGTAFDFKPGQILDVEQQRRTLLANGYNHVDTVTERGEYALRGSVLDIFPMGAELPVRIDLFDNEIDTLRTFDPESQRTVERIEALNMLPAKEFPFDASAISRFRDRWHHTFNVDVRRCGVYQDVSSHLAPNGIEYYLPFFFEELGTLFDYLPQNVILVTEQNVSQEAEHHLSEVLSRYESLRHDIERPILPPNNLYLAINQLHEGFNRYPQVRLQQADEQNLNAQESGNSTKHQVKFSSASLPDLLADARQSSHAQSLNNFIQARKLPALFVAESAGRREIFDELLSKAGIQTKVVDHYQDYLTANQHCITIGDLADGSQFGDYTIVTETDVLGTRQSDPRRESGGRIIDPEQIVKNLTELNIGAPVVHIDHGVGRYLGLQTLSIGGENYEFLTLAYADDDKLYVPVTALHLIGRYAGSDEEHAPLHRLGSDQWEKAKRRAAEKVVDVAAELLDIYARRELRTSYKFDLNPDEYEKFAAEFPFEVTQDQQAAIEDTIADMTTMRAMDRLICGDVGFGKTEVALRAAFIAVQAGKQVAVLVPTTLLAQQHFDTFRDRFAAWPVSIDSISRLRTTAEIQEISSQLKTGKLDIIVGTHKLLSDALEFKDIGLIIIDEEHRFGVRQKERLKSMRAEVDVLTLTATPIPRTLNMALSGIRDLSIIATPPAKRLSIKTFVQEKRSHQVREAISRELLRGGQVFYLHNEVRNIDNTANEILDLVPEARVGIGHGQMPKKDLEHVMSDFYHRQLNVLVCTTIIETGIDIPNANTIIIERADKFGLAQLHQLRGRVGRSHRQAYAYLLTPHPKTMTKDAVKRLEAIEAAGELGVGFTLATHDMEIRGAGELLGDDQSGQIEAIGFSMYMDMLDRAVSAIRAGELPNPDAPLETVSQEVNLHASTLIPEDYLPDVHTRLILYKRVSAAKNSTQLDNLQVEIIDRFGLLPPPMKRLFDVTQLKLASQKLGIVKVDMGEERGKLEFSNTTQVDPIKIINLVQREPNTYKLEGAAKLRIYTKLPSFEERVKFTSDLLQALTPDTQPATPTQQANSNADGNNPMKKGKNKNKKRAN